MQDFRTRIAAVTKTSAAKIRLGLFVDSRFQPRWLYRAVERIAQSDFAEVVLFAIRPLCVPGSQPRPGSHSEKHRSPTQRKTASVASGINVDF
jgi:hypothetical protein